MFENIDESIYIHFGKHNTLWMSLLTSNTYKSTLALEIQESLKPSKYDI